MFDWVFREEGEKDEKKQEQQEVDNEEEATETSLEYVWASEGASNDDR